MRDRIVKFFSGLYGTSGKELGGLIVLGALIISGIVVVNWVDDYTTLGYQNYQADREVLDSLIATMEEKTEPETRPIPVNYFLFNPNSSKLEELISLGLDSVIAARIIKYRNKGGVYRQKSDLKKIYGLSANQYNTLHDYIDLPDQIINSTASVHQPELTRTNRVVPVAKEESLPIFDINLADTSMLQSIRGIGTVLAQRIVSFRGKLGGYVALNQLYQVYHLDSTVVDRLKKVSIIAPNFTPNKIQINMDKVEEIASHPYITWNQAKLLIAYRAQHGAFSTTKDLTEVYSFDEQLVQKISPYITFASE